MSDLPPRRFQIDDEDDTPLRRRRSFAEEDRRADRPFRDDAETPATFPPSRVGPLLLGLAFGLGIGLIATVVVWALTRPSTESARPIPPQTAESPELLAKVKELETKCGLYAEDLSQQQKAKEKAEKELASQRKRADEQTALAEKWVAELAKAANNSERDNEVKRLLADRDKQIADLRFIARKSDLEEQSLRVKVKALEIALVNRATELRVGKRELTALELKDDGTCHLFPPGYEAKVELLSPVIYTEDNLIPRETTSVDYDSSTGKLRVYASEQNPLPKQSRLVLPAGTVLKVTQTGAMPTYHQLSDCRFPSGAAKKPPTAGRTDHILDLIPLVQPSLRELPVGVELGFAGDCTIRVGEREITLTAKGTILEAGRDYPHKLTANGIMVSIEKLGTIHIDVPTKKGERQPEVEIVTAAIVPAKRVKGAPEQPVLARFQKPSPK